MTRSRWPFTWQGQLNLGEVVRRSRRGSKPDWVPVRGNLSDAEYEALMQKERHSAWDLRSFCEILNREYGLTGDAAYNYHHVRQLEEPPRKRAEPPRQLLRDVIDLKICINPTTAQPFTEEEFDLICQERMDVNGVLLIECRTD